ncbi:hypothetical protein B0H12DRAFT_1231047 [Mycena haematopus]|nr:hypothetical protein B0H12DRAFT_1231047 [Mycena haematopus]
MDDEEADMFVDDMDEDEFSMQADVQLNRNPSRTRFQATPLSMHSDNDDVDDDTPPPLRHPLSLAHLRAALYLTLGLGRSKAVEWVLWSEETTEDPCGCSRLDLTHMQAAAAAMCRSDLNGEEDDSGSEQQLAAGRDRPERNGARRLAEETRDTELGPAPAGEGGGGDDLVGTGVDDQQPRAALEPSVTVTGLSSVNPPSHSLSQVHHAISHCATPSGSGGTYSGLSAHATPVFSLPSPAESSRTRSPHPRGDGRREDTATMTALMQVPNAYAHAAAHRSYSRAHSCTHSHMLLHSVSMREVKRGRS